MNLVTLNFSSPLRPLVVGFCLAFSGAAFALPSAPASPQISAAPAAPALFDKSNQRIERIRTEDAGSRIDEVRVGGETQSITVQPKVNARLPAYDVKPSDTAKGAAPSPSSSDTNGARVWNVLKF